MKIKKPKPDYRSNHGKGPLVARVIREQGRFVIMERWNERNKSYWPVRFWLPLDYLTKSPSCGWEPI